jgi:uncharacterized damage-inducible protein DinB
MNDDTLRYPIGHWSAPATDAATLAALVDDIEAAPAALRAAVAGLDDARLDTPYRDGGWTVRQLVHHVADSHANAYIRVKKALTEPGAPIVAYEEARWAELPDSRLPIDVSLALLDALHVRWVATLRAASADDLAKTYRHPEMGEVPLTTALAIYAWHGKHHTAHVTRLRERMGW